MGVQAFSNGDNNGIVFSTIEETLRVARYQCVEYVKRYYKDRSPGVQIDLSQPIGVASNYYNGYDNPTYSYIRESGFARFEQGGLVMPKSGDI